MPSPTVFCCASTMGSIIFQFAVALIVAPSGNSGKLIVALWKGTHCYCWTSMERWPQIPDFKTQLNWEVYLVVILLMFVNLFGKGLYVMDTYLYKRSPAALLQLWHADECIGYNMTWTYDTKGLHACVGQYPISDTFKPSSSLCGIHYYCTL